MSYATLLAALRNAGLSSAAAGEVFSYLATTTAGYAPILAAIQAMGMAKNGGAERLAYDISAAQGYTELLAALRATGAAGGGAAEWLALELASLSPPPPGTPVFLFDAQNIDGTANSSLVDGQTLGTWINGGSTGAGGNAVQATGGLRPTFKKVASAGKLNNLSSVLFTPTQWMQTANTATFAQPNVICVITKIAAASTIADGNDAVNRNDILSSAGTWQQFAGTALYNSTLASGVGTYHVLRSLYNTTLSTIRANKVTSTPGTSPGAASIDGISLGVAGDATSPLNGEIVEVVVYGAGTAPADALLDAYFDAKYGSSWPQ